VEWLASHALAIGSALLAALFAAVGIVVRQRAIQAEAATEADSGAIVTSWVRQPSWWLGTLGAIGGYVFQALALAHGSLLLVQPLLVTSLLFVLPLGARFSNQHVRARDWGWALLLTAALTIFVLVGQPREGHYRAPVPAWSVALGTSVPVVIICVLAARRATGRPRAMLLASGVAVLLGMVAVLTKVSTHRLALHGWHGLMTVPAPYLLVVLAITVTVLQQSAFHAGALQASVPIMLVGEPIVAVLLGVVILGEYLVVHDASAAILAVAVAAMTAATIALGRDSAAPALAAETSTEPESVPDVAGSNRQPR
jgi:drug/metabolite transporter (DMT)-like permease